MSRRFGRALAAAAALSLAGCRGVQTMLDPTGDQARHVDVIWRAMLWVCGIMYVLVLGFLAWALVRAWRNRAAAPSPPVAGPTPAEPLLARGLTAWSGLVVAGLIGLVAVTFLVDRSLAEATPNPLKITVTARQWWWQVDYHGAQDGDVVTTANELHLPLNRPAVIELHAGDVIHSFWVPNLAGKVDLIPGRTNYVAVTPRRMGSFRGQCAEFCGLEHALMAFDVTVEDQNAFEAWRAHQREEAAQPGDPASTHGRDIFTSHACIMCHRISGTEAGAANGPDLTHVASRTHLAAGALPNTRPALQAWIADPQGNKPGTTMPRVQMTSEELNDLATYLETLK